MLRFGFHFCSLRGEGSAIPLAHEQGRASDVPRGLASALWRKHLGENFIGPKLGEYVSAKNTTLKLFPVPWGCCQTGLQMFWIPSAIPLSVLGS